MRRGERDGAALVTAIFVIAVLLAIAVTFWKLAGQEARTARNVAYNVRARMLAEGGVHIAIAALNADLVASRAITSIDRIANIYYQDRWESVYYNILTGQENNIAPGDWLPVYADPVNNRDIVGRYVFAIVDEATKLNVNIAGNPGIDLWWRYFGASTTDRYAHLSSEGVSPAEIDLGAPWPTESTTWTTTIRSGENGLAHKFPFFRFGAPEGEPVLGGAPPAIDPPIDDSAFPGRANWDDDGDNLFVSSNGVDDDGDGLIDEYWRDGIDNDGDGFIDEADELPVEGVDEPDEFRVFNPVAGDRAFKTIDQTILLSGIGEGTLEALRDFITVDSFDRAALYRPQVGPHGRAEDLRVNLNLAGGQTIAKSLIERRPEVFAAGDAAKRKACQIAANIADFADLDFARTEVVDPTDGSVFSGVEPIRINEIMVRPIRRVEAEGGPGFSVTWGGEPGWQVEVDGEGIPREYWTDQHVDVPPDGVNDLVASWQIDAVDFQGPEPGLLPSGWYYLLLDFSSLAGDPTLTTIDWRVVTAAQDSGWRTIVPNPLLDDLVDIEGNPVPVLVDMVAGGRVDPVDISLAAPVTVFLRKNANDGQRVHFNGVAFSQEPDMEWVEIVNVGTKPVQLDGWELEVAGGAVGAIPPGTTIAAGGTMVLAVDKAEFPFGADPDMSLFNNALSILNSPFPQLWDPAEPNVVQLDFRGLELNASRDRILPGGLLPNDPANDGLDSDGDNETLTSDGEDNDGDDEFLSSDGVDNDGDGFVDEPGEGIDEPGEGIDEYGNEMQVITLYEGAAQWGRVVDRVTYTSGDVADSRRGGAVVLRNDPTRDFYRSLERINPYYPGDTIDDTGRRDGNYDRWDANGDTDQITPDLLVPGARFGTPLLTNVTATEWSEARGDLELVAPTVKNANFSTVGELLDVPYYRNLPGPMLAAESRPTRIPIPEVALILELATTSRLDMTCGVADEPTPPTWYPVTEFIGDPTDPPGMIDAAGTRADDNPVVAYYNVAPPAAGSRQAVWEWNAQDGLEDGVYALYVYVGEFAQQIAEITGGTWEGSPDRRPVSIEVFSIGDADGDGIVGNNEWRSYGMIGNVVPRHDGVIPYGLVNVRRSMLRLSLRNEADDGVVNTFTRIALAPRQRDYGKININNVETVQVGPEPDDVVNVLSALPGLIQEYDASTGSLVPSPDSTDPNVRLAATRRANAIVDLRVDDSDPPQPLPYASIGELLETMVLSPNRFALGAPPSRWLDETLERFKGISNLITVRSDVFEIICTAQAGNVLDANGDGELEWGIDEFVPLAEKKLRVVYER